VKICSTCAIGKITEYAVKHTSFFTEFKYFINDIRVVLVHYSKTKMLNCDECGEKKQNLYRDEKLSV
jgi:hypothetical protein